MKRIVSGLALALAVAACASGSPAADAGGAQHTALADGGGTAIPDAGASGGCAEEGEACGASVPCCTITCADGSALQVNLCDPVSATCLPNLGDAGTPSCPSPGGGDGGAGVDGGPPDDCAVWAPQVVAGPLVILLDATAPAGLPPLAVGAGGGLGQIVVGAAPGAPSPADAGPGFACGPLLDAGPTQTWTPLAGLPAAAALAGVWADPQGDVFAVGRGGAGTALWLGGTLDGGLSVLDLDGGPSAASLVSVLGLGDGEALAVGFGSGGPIALRFAPDGGVVAEPVDPSAGVSRLYRLAGLPAGPILALGDAPGPSGTLLPAALSLFQRVDGGWVSAGAPAGPVELWDVSVAANGDVWLAGDDGVGDGLAFAWTPDGGFAPLDLSAFSAVAPLLAVRELPGGDVLFASVPDPANDASGAPPQMLRWSGGSWSRESLPGGTLSVSAIVDDGAGETLAVGSQECPDCDAGELPLVLLRLLP